MDKEIIYIGFSRPNHWFEPFSWAIRLFQWTPYSHVYFRSNSKSLDREIIYQASGLTVNFIGLNRFRTKEIIIKEFSLEISPDAKLKTLQFCIDSAGAPYGVKEIVGFAWVFANSWIGRKVKNPFADGEKSFVCSEFVGDILKELGADLSDTEILGPKQIYQYLETHFKKSN